MFLAVTGLSGCQQEQSEETVKYSPVHIHDGQECALCGMIINQFPGPKGQLFIRGNDKPLSFCSTRDLFAYATQEEHKHRIKALFVHETVSAPWDDMVNAQYIPARSAFFVVGHSKLGAMGPTLASFHSEESARSFADSFGGEVLPFDAVNQTVLNRMNHLEMNLHSDN
jgi:copper chaperone NosL